jgi:pimeloyl-ACP methyl ester carboxylesterase
VWATVASANHRAFDRANELIPGHKKNRCQSPIMHRRRIPAQSHPQPQAFLPQPGAMRAGFAQFLAFSQDAADNRTFLEQGKLQMPVLAFGGEATFGPMIGAVIRCVADNVEDVIIPDCGHWITEEQRQATTDLVVDFLRQAR